MLGVVALGTWRNYGVLGCEGKNVSVVAPDRPRINWLVVGGNAAFGLGSGWARRAEGAALEVHWQ
jgi:hypothetical protein